MKWTFLLLSACLLSIGCRQGGQKSSDASSLAAYFQAITPSDTMRFEVFADQDTSAAVRIPTSEFFRKMPTRLMNDIWYFDNTGPMRVFARTRFALHDGEEALLADLRQNWYQHQSLFIYDPQRDTIIDRTTVAEFYGGEGGQIITGSYLFDFDGDGDKDLVRREIEHWLDTSGPEPVDRYTHHVYLLLWDAGKFREAPVPDSAALIAAFPIDSLVGGE